MRNIIYIPYGVGLEFVPTKKNPLKWVVPYNRLNSGQKNIGVHASLSASFNKVMLGKIDHLFIVFGSMSRGKVVDLSPYTMVEQPATREEYLSIISDRGAFLCTSNYESFGIYYLELMCTGAVGVFLKKSWVDLLLPGYPLIANDKEEALGMMVSVSRQYDYWHEVLVTEWVPYIRKTYDLQEFATRIVSL